MPLCFFADKETIEIIKKYRRELPTHYVEYKLQDFYTDKFKDKMITHPIHCPSIELNLIWNEKTKNININPLNSDFFRCIDASICTFIK